MWTIMHLLHDRNVDPDAFWEGMVGMHAKKNQPKKFEYWKKMLICCKGFGLSFLVKILNCYDKISRLVENLFFCDFPWRVATLQWDGFTWWNYNI